MDIKALIESGKAYLGIEFGSTRIKAVLVDGAHEPIASGSHDWENAFEGGFWTYSEEAMWKGLQDCYANLKEDVKARYGVALTKLGGLGISGMMHGYLAFDKNGKMLVPFRTWRNSTTEQAAEELTKLFSFNIPLRWSIAHLYQAILNGESHVTDIAYLTTLSGFIHWKLTGEKVLGVGDASGVMPFDSEAFCFDKKMLKNFNEKIAAYKVGWKFEDIMPKVLNAGENAGVLTKEGVKLLDVSGTLEAGIPMCPPEGDAGTGMVATNSVRKRTGNVSAGTSVFAMIVLEKAFKKLHTEIDMVTTPSGAPVAMVHCNNCTTDLNAWVGLFSEFAQAMGAERDMNKFFSILYNKAMEADRDCDGILSYNYFSGEHMTGFEEGRPLVVRTPQSKFNLANFMRSLLYASLATLKIGMDTIFEEEQVEVDKMLGHGGLFKTKGVAQSILAAAINAPVSVMETAGEGGAWGIAILATYMANKKQGEKFEDYLDEKVFAGKKSETLAPIQADVDGFNAYVVQFKKGLPIERAAVENLQ